MAIQFNAANGRNSTLQNMMTQLHQTLLAAGWEIVYADTDAIGTGSASTPAWSKTPAITTSAGTAVYRMPVVSGYPTRWCVSLNPRWASASGGITWGIYATWGTDSTSGGVLTNPGNVQTFTTNSTSANNNSTEWYVIAYEHGFLLALHQATGGWLYCGERRRRMDGTLLDDLNTYGCTKDAVAQQFASMGGVNSGYTGIAMSRTATAGEQGAQMWVVFATSTGGQPYTLNRMDGATGIPQGPINVSNGTSGVPRLFVLLPTNDSVVGVDNILAVDGSNRAYHVASAASITSGSTLQTRVAYAKE